MVRYPERNAVIAGLIAVTGLVLLGLGIRDDMFSDDAGPMAGLGGLGLLATIMGVIFFANFLWAAWIVRAMRGGRTAIARWTLPAEEFARWREIDRRFAERGQPNDYRAPQRVPADGLEVIFSDDGVLIGGCYFGLATSGLNHFKGVRPIASDPPMIEFGTATKAATNLSGLRIWTIRGTLRVPVASAAAAQGHKVAERYQAIASRRVIVNPHFWTRRIRSGLVVAAVSAPIAIAGFAFADRNTELANVPLVLVIGGLFAAVGGLIVALGAWLQRRAQYGR